MRYRIGVIGATGYIGTPYRQEIREARQDADIVAVCARRRDRLEAAAREDGASLLTDDWQAVVDHPDINLVLVLTPDALHYEPIMASITAGKHVLCEKPIGRDATQAHAMWQAANEQAVASFVPFWTRYVPIFCRLKQLVDQGVAGDIRSVIYRWHNPRPVSMPFTWRDDANLSAAGSIADVGSHAYDTLRYILGNEARRVLTHAQVVMPAKPDLGNIDLSEAITWGEQSPAAGSSDQRRGTAPDYAQIGFEYEDGCIGSILVSHASYLRKGFAAELEVHGTRASLAVDRVHNELWIADSPEPARRLEEVAQPATYNRFEQFVFPAFDQQLSGECCTHPMLHDGWRVQVFTDAAAESARRGTWVELSEFDHER